MTVEGDVYVEADYSNGGLLLQKGDIRGRLLQFKGTTTIKEDYYSREGTMTVLEGEL